MRWLSTVDHFRIETAWVIVAKGDVLHLRQRPCPGRVGDPAARTHRRRPRHRTDRCVMTSTASLVDFASALETVEEWLTEYISASHPEIGRTGPICPFRSALAQEPDDGDPPALGRPRTDPRADRGDRPQQSARVRADDLARPQSDAAGHGGRTPRPAQRGHRTARPSPCPGEGRLRGSGTHDRPVPRELRRDRRPQPPGSR
ncbi:hypothetical protein LV779_36250 [Streptomyces thinghirensis]|nr:hypothetical protein [Streptomyces thinghirensis]